jgi:AcrR family transcriptional regulator
LVAVAASPASTKRPTRRRQSAKRQALVLAASHLFADAGPAQVSIRDVANAAGCSHALVGRHFGSKSGLESAVVSALADDLDELAERQRTQSEWSVGLVLAEFRRTPRWSRLMTRIALGELDHVPLTGGSSFMLDFAGSIERRHGGDAGQPSETARIATLVAFGMVLGAAAYEGLLESGCRASEVSHPDRDAAIAEAAEYAVSLVMSGHTTLTIDSPPVASAAEPVDLTTVDARTALVEATIELSAAHGPASLSTREIADRAGVNQGLIYHYFDSREHLLRVAIEQANRPLEALVDADRPFDVYESVRRHRETRSLRILARLEANGVAITEVRDEFVVFDRLLAAYPNVPTGPGTTGLSDPRLAVMTATVMSLGATLFDGILRRMLDLPPTAALDPALATIASHLLDRAV